VAKGSGYSGAEVKAGVFLTFCIGMFVAMLFIYGKASRLWKGHSEISVCFTSVTSLRPDAPVRLNGVEVGRVRAIEIVPMTQERLKLFPPFKLQDIDNLPLTDRERADLRKMNAPPPEATADMRLKFDQTLDLAVREKIAERTMIKLVLEVQGSKGGESEGKLYRVDDQIRIATTLLGDTSVEIASGNGDPNDGQERLLLGVSGDFFTSLQKSIEQVKEILHNVSEVVGQDERKSIQSALKRFDSITKKIESVVDLAAKRLPATWDKVDVLADSAREDLDGIGKTITGLQPQIMKTLTSADEAIKELQKRLVELSDEAKSTIVEVRGQVKPILEDIHYITANSKDDFPVLIKNAKDLASRLKLSADKLDGVLATGDRLLQESYPDLRRLILAFRMGAENFEEATSLIKRKPWLVMNKPKEDGGFENANAMAGKLDHAMKSFRELNMQLQAVRRNMPANATKQQTERVDFLVQELSVLLDTLEFAGESMKKDVLPPFERKKGSFLQVPEAKEIQNK